MARIQGTQILVNYGARGLGAVGAIQLINNFAPQIMANQWLSYGLYGITIGAILAAGLGIYAVDSLILK